MPRLKNIRYIYELDYQFFGLDSKDGQEEVAESWLEMGNPWEIVRHDASYPVKFCEVILGEDGKKEWVGGEDIIAVAYDVPIPGYKTKTTINLRLWSTKAEKICYVLYPGDESNEGKTLRLKQQYTLCSASLQDIIARFETRSGEPVNWDTFPNKVAVQMNDTHPTLCIPELKSHIDGCERFELEWAALAVNGVAEIHSEIVKREVFNDFYKLWPEKFQNKTNGVTPRRWISFCNPHLSKIITKWTGTEDWLINTEKLADLRKFADNEELQSEWREAKRSNKMKVVSFLKEKTGYIVNPDAMFDVQLVNLRKSQG
ncbi:hypothetical protein LOK49_LG14G00326 [Camellia lanceoleosa]|uniref:Uncharacterized protein n=1 Tax=Camellia lanceoleosa TaxID=1840588 RepID=A0ACC0F8U8_9ERIC|nr:hypothetical protein LOK49_LG14G00326 [Camellia lanceoleosa]